MKKHEAWGHPGMEPRWTQGSKDGVGTAYAASSRVWFTLWNGVMTEVYYPTVDLPQTRDLQLLITDGHSFFQEEKRHLTAHTERLPNSLGYRVINTDPQDRYRIVKEIICEPHLPCVLQSCRLEGDEAFLTTLKLYVLCAPHIGGGGWGNNAEVLHAAGRKILAAHKRGGITEEETWLALAASVPFGAVSCGYSGQSDGWTDLADNFQLDWQFDSAPDGNVALTGELLLSKTEDGAREFTLGLAFGDGSHSAVTTLLQSLAVPFADQRERFLTQWQRPSRNREALDDQSGDDGALYDASVNVLLAHEDKRYPGALIASLSIPWGEAKGDEDTGGYHLVWPRDMVNSATGLMAAGKHETAFRAMIYLAASQNEDGGFAQNFWIDGRPYWSGIQLDEVAFPILLARKLHNAGELRDFDPLPTVLRAAGFLVKHGPVTAQERWEEASGLSPSTLAACIAALICTAAFAREAGDETTAQFLEEHADFIDCHLERWCATREGCLLPGVERHFVRIHPCRPGDPLPKSPPDFARYGLASRPPGSQVEFAAREVVDAGFLELVRYGIRPANDPLIMDSLRVCDAVLKVETPNGPCWRRYNGDGYGQKEDGAPYDHWGVGRAWPLLAGERAHYELAAGGDTMPFVRALEAFASRTQMLPEQVWDAPDLPAQHQFLGHSTGAARPLAWAHAEYLKLLRSRRDGQIFDRVPEAAERYLGGRAQCRLMGVWSPHYPQCSLRAGYVLRVQHHEPFVLRWTRDDWQTQEDKPSSATSLGVHFADIQTATGQKASLKFTFFFSESGQWAGRDFEVESE